jgi:uncharacterized membrane protein SirB2
MDIYQVAFSIHVSSVVISGSFFIVRGYWMIMRNPMLQHRLVRIVPHIVDSVLLVSAITLTLILKQYPVAQNWLAVKVLLLLVYIVLGTFALHRGRTYTIRLVCFVAAVATFAFMASVAYYHHPLGAFS